MSKHTPTPWEYFILDKAKDEIGTYVQGCVDKSPEENFYFISGTHPDGGAADVAHIGNGPTSAVNAEFIVRAVNSHDALLDACKFALGEMEHLEQFDNLSYFDTDRIKAAIKLAEEGKR